MKQGKRGLVGWCRWRAWLLTSCRHSCRVPPYCTDIPCLSSRCFTVLLCRIRSLEDRPARSPDTNYCNTQWNLQPHPASLRHRQARVRRPSHVLFLYTLRNSEIIEAEKTLWAIINRVPSPASSSTSRGCLRSRLWRQYKLPWHMARLTSHSCTRCRPAGNSMSLLTTNCMTLMKALRMKSTAKLGRGYVPCCLQLGVQDLAQERHLSLLQCILVASS